MNRWATPLKQAIVGAAVAWSTALPLATYAASRPAPTPVPYLFALSVYVVGGTICHQRPERSFQLWGRPMPVCARCTGIYLGAAVALLFQALRRRRQPSGPRRERSWPPLSPPMLLAIGAMPAFATLVFEWTTGVTPGNLVRAATGVLLGAVVASLVIYEVN